MPHSVILLIVVIPFFSWVTYMCIKHPGPDNTEYQEQE